MSCRRLTLASLLALSCALPWAARRAGASSPTYLPSDEGDAQKLVTDRLGFIQEMYQPPPNQQDTINKLLRQLVPQQEMYVKEWQLTLRRTSLVVTLVGNDQKLSPMDRPAKLKMFQDQIARIRARAPLSLANACRKAEQVVSSDQAAAAHARMQARFSDQLRLLGAPFDLDQLDAVAEPPVMPGPPVEVPRPPPPRQPPLWSDVRKERAEIEGSQRRAELEAIRKAAANQPPRPSTPTSPTAQAAAPIQPPQPVHVVPPAPPPPPRPVGPAPPESDWAKHVEAVTAKYGFTEAQKKSADTVLTQTKARAAKADVSKNTKQIDVIYDQMMQRLDAIASMEQKTSAGKSVKANPKPPAPVK